MLLERHDVAYRRRGQGIRAQNALDQHASEIQVTESNGESAHSPIVDSVAPTSHHPRKPAYFRIRGSDLSILVNVPTPWLGICWVGRDYIEHFDGQIAKSGCIRKE